MSLKNLFLTLAAVVLVACSGAASKTTYTNQKHKYTVQTTSVWGVHAEQGPPAEADDVTLFRVVDAPGKKGVYDPKTILTGDAPFNCNVLQVHIQAQPNPDKLEPLEFLKRKAEADGFQFKPEDYEKTTLNGREAVRDKSSGGQRYILNVGSTLFTVHGIELFGRETGNGTPLSSNPEAVKILQETMDTVKFEG